MSSLNYGSFGRRLLATLLDAAILVIPMAIGSHLVPVVGAALVAFLYAPVFESSELRATIGKHLMGLQVCDLAGRRITFQAGAIRLLMKFISSVLLFLGHLLALFTERKQALHDLVAETVVVFGRNERSIADAWIEQVRSVMRLGGSKNTLSELERLQALRAQGALSEEEFQREKNRIFGSA